MNIKQKIKEVLVNCTTAAGLAAVVAMGSSATARADFFDGMPGPKPAQVHYTINLAEETSHNLALKYFGADLMAVLAADLNAEGVQGGFAGVGYLGNLNGIGILPVIGYSGNDERGAAHAVVQVTAPIGENLVIDGNYHAVIPAHGNEDHTPIHQFGLTPSIGNSEFRIGPELGLVIGEDPTLRLLMRYDLDSENHGEWVELGVNPDGGVQLQFRGNFNL